MTVVTDCTNTPTHATSITLFPASTFITYGYNMAANLVEVITPMPDSSAKTRAEAALERVKSLVIRTHDDYAAAAADLAEVKGQFRAVDKQREELKAPSLEACRRVDSFFKPPLQFL